MGYIDQDPNQSRKLELRVAEAYKSDVGKGIARLDPKLMDQLGLETGDVIQIQGTSKALSKVLPDHPGLSKPDTIRLDPQTRENAGVRLDDKVIVSKAHTSPARSITLAPAFRYHPIWMGLTPQFLAQPGRILEGVPLIKGQKLRLDIMGTSLDFVVTSTDPSGPVIVTRDTSIQISEAPVAEAERKIPAVSYEDIGGLKRELSLVREMIELPLRHPELFERVGIEPPKGVLLHGPPGTGKTLIAKAVANEAGAHFISVSGPEFMSKFYGESERRLREIFKEAEQNAPSIIFFDEIDSIAPKRSEVMGEVERRIVAQLLSLMDGLKARGKVIVIGATNRIDALDPALRRPGRFDREIEIGIPNRDGRLEILQIHTRGMPLGDDVNLEELADITHGFVGADLAALCREAAMRAIRRLIPEVERFKEELPPELIQKLKVTRGDFMEALKGIQPSALREVFVEIPKVHWDDIGGLEKIKQELIEAVVWPLKYPELYKQLGTRAPKGILLFGPPGTGKTMLAKAVATESEANFISIRGPEIISKWVGESERAIREVFRKARMAAPCIIFFDEIDSVAPSRGYSTDARVTERVVSQLLTELDGLVELKDVVVLAATNRPDIIDPALLRPGRFDRLIYIGPPDAEERRKIFQVHLRNKPLASDVKLDELVNATEGWVGADIASLCREAGLAALREFLSYKLDPKHLKEASKNILISWKHFQEGFKRVKPTCSQKELQDFRRKAEQLMGYV